jgi:hypothetical protein
MSTPDVPTDGGRQWGIPERAPHPAPLQPMRDATPDEIPEGARRLVDKLGEGWTHRVTYARGWTMNANGERGHLIDSVAVRMRHAHGGSAVAVWEAAEGQSARFAIAFVWVRCPGGPTCARGGAREHPIMAPSTIGARDLAVLVSDDDTIGWWERTDEATGIAPADHATNPFDDPDDTYERTPDDDDPQP